MFMGEANKVVAAAAQAARAAAPPPLGNHVPNALLWPLTHLRCCISLVAMVNGTLGPLTATEAQDLNDVVGEFGASHGGI